MLLQDDSANCQFTHAMRLPLILWSIGRSYLFDYRDHSTADYSSFMTLQPSPPINSIPLELLGEIFTTCLQLPDPLLRYSSSHDALSISPTESIDPMTLAQVCRHWRAVALSMPTLWASMRICSPRRGHLQLTRLWLERSRVCPLHLSLSQDDSFHPSASDAERAITGELLALLLPQIHRWRSIDFRFVGKVHFSLSRILPGSLMQLESARVWVLSAGRGDPASLDRMWRTIHATTTLRHVHWDGEYLATLPLHMPWMRLTRIHINGRLPTSVIFNLLRSCQSVVDLELHLQENSSTPSSAVVLPCLNYLFIWSECALDPIFDQLTLPRISSLRLVRCGDPITFEELNSFNDLLVRSRCFLQRLYYSDGQREATRSKILAMLRLPRLSRLNDLEIMSCIGDQVIRALACRHQCSQNHLLPMLENILIGDCRGTTPGLLGDMVSSRVVARGELVKLRFLKIFDWSCNPVDKEVLKRLSGDGMHVSVTYDEQFMQ